MTHTEEKNADAYRDKTTVSVSPSGEIFPLPGEEDYRLEFDRLQDLVKKQRQMGREIVVVMGVGFVGAVMAGVVYYAEQSFSWQAAELKQQIMVLFLLIGIALFSYVLVLLLLGVRPAMIKNVSTAES